VKKFFCVVMLAMLAAAAVFAETYTTMDYYGNRYVVYVNGGKVSGSSPNGLVCYGSVTGNSLLVYFFDGRTRIISRAVPSSTAVRQRSADIYVYAPGSSIQVITPGLRDTSPPELQNYRVRIYGANQAPVQPAPNTRAAVNVYLEPGTKHYYYYPTR
jgi:hypothetical protein